MILRKQVCTSMKHNLKKIKLYITHNIRMIRNLVHKKKYLSCWKEKNDKKSGPQNKILELLERKNIHI